MDVKLTLAFNRPAFRPLAHCGYHVGQIILTARILAGENWKTITIPRGASPTFNQRVWGSGSYKKAADPPEAK